MQLAFYSAAVSSTQCVYIPILLRAILIYISKDQTSSDNLNYDDYTSLQCINIDSRSGCHGNHK